MSEGERRGVQKELVVLRMVCLACYLSLYCFSLSFQLSIHVFEKMALGLDVRYFRYYYYYLLTYLSVFTMGGRGRNVYTTMEHELLRAIDAVMDVLSGCI